MNRGDTVTRDDASPLGRPTTRAYAHAHAHARARTESPSLENGVIPRHRVTASPPLVALLGDIEARLRRLAPCHRDPERFHFEKGELIGMLQDAAAALRKEAGGHTWP